MSHQAGQSVSKRPPLLPDSFMQTPSPWVVVGFLAYALTMAFGPALLSYWLLVYSGWSMLIVVPAMVVLNCISGFGFYVTAYLGHEGFHFTLTKNQFVSGFYWHLVQLSRRRVFQPGVLSGT